VDTNILNKKQLSLIGLVHAMCSNGPLPQVEESKTQKTKETYYSHCIQQNNSKGCKNFEKSPENGNIFADT
jgi:hypothetical protein